MREMGKKIMSQYLSMPQRTRSKRNWSRGRTVIESHIQVTYFMGRYHLLKLPNSPKPVLPLRDEVFKLFLSQTNGLPVFNWTNFHLQLLRSMHAFHGQMKESLIF